MRVLNVGGGAGRTLPAHFDGWEQHVLDIDPEVKPDICLDAREMMTLPAATHDAVLCSHTLEHFYKHDVPRVLDGFLHVLKAEGFAEIVVPNLTHAFSAMAKSTLDVSDVWYRTSGGVPITFHDVLYGWDHAMQNGNLYYAHKCGFTLISLGEMLMKSGFAGAQMWDDAYSLYARAFRTKPCPQP